MPETKREGRTGRRVTLALAGLFALGAPAWGSPPARDPEATEATGVFPIEGESILVVKGVPGQVVVSSRREREVRFASRAKDRTGSDRPIGVWFDGSTVTLAPIPGQAAPEGILRVEVPESFAVRIEAAGGSTLVEGLSGFVEINAKDTDVRGLSLTGSLAVAVERGVLRLSEVYDATVRAKDAVVNIDNVRSNLLARLAGATKLTGAGIQGDLEIDSDDATFNLQRVDGSVRVRARGGSGEGVKLGAGGDFQLASTPLVLSECVGDFTINSDAAVAFNKMKASLHLDLYGGSLRGAGNQGLVEVRTRNSEIALEGIDGPVRIQGDGLKVKITEVSGDLYVDAAVSEVAIVKAGSGVGLKIDRSDVMLQGALGLVTGTITGGDVQFTDLTGAVALEIEGGDADIGWVSISGETDTLVRNAGGAVTLRFPASAACRVEAKTKFGRIESELATVRVLDGGTEAQGPVGPGRRPTIKVEAEGNINLLGGPAARQAAD